MTPVIVVLIILVVLVAAGIATHRISLASIKERIDALHEKVPAPPAQPTATVAPSPLPPIMQPAPPMPTVVVQPPISTTPVPVPPVDTAAVASPFGYGGSSPYAGKLGPNGYPLDTRGFEIIPEVAKPFDPDGWALGLGYAWITVVKDFSDKPGFDFSVLQEGNYHIDGGWGALDSETKWRIVKDGVTMMEESIGGQSFHLTTGVAHFYCEANRAAFGDAIIAARAGSGGISRSCYILRRDF